MRQLPWIAALLLSGACADSRDLPVPAVLRPNFAPDIELAGIWRIDWRHGYVSAVLEIREVEPDRYLLDYTYRMCTGAIQQRAIARWTGCSLRVQGALEPTRAGSDVPLVFYPVRVAGEERLVPLRAGEEFFEPDECELVLQTRQQEQAFHRVPVRS